MNNLYDKDNLKKDDDKVKVILAVIVCFILFISSLGLFFYSYNQYKEKYNIEDSEDKTSNFVYDENINSQDKKDRVKDNETDSHKENIENKINAEEKTDINEINDGELNFEEVKVKRTVKKFLDSVRSRNKEEACKYSENNECGIIDKVDKQLNPQDNSIVQYNMFFEKMMDFNYVVENVNCSGDEAEALVYIETYNFTTKVLEARLNVTDNQVASSFGKGHLDDSDKKKIAKAEVKEVLDNMDRKLRIPVKVSLVLVNGEWKIKSESIDNGIENAVMKNLYDSIQAYYDFYVALNNNEVSVLSIDSFVDYLASKGIYYEENGETSPFNK